MIDIEMKRETDIIKITEECLVMKSNIKGKYIVISGIMINANLEIAGICMKKHLCVDIIKIVREQDVCSTMTRVNKIICLIIFSMEVKGGHSGKIHGQEQFQVKAKDGR